MNEPKSEYLLLFRNNVWYEKLSPEEIQKVMMERCGASQMVKEAEESQL